MKIWIDQALAPLDCPSAGPGTTGTVTAIIT
jgi:hypothetical protein